MGRRYPGAAPDGQHAERAGTEQLQYRLKLITPQVGGSATAREPNRRVRTSSVANSLRNWWRVLNADTYPDTETLFEAESLLWGSTSRQAQCRICVSVDRLGDVENLEHPYGKYPEYALFPFNPDPVAKLVTGTLFTLTVNFPARYRDELDAAVRAFVAFGGLGARTRRGCGSLALQEGALALPSGSIAEHSSTLTMLPTHAFWGPATANPVSAWSSAVNVYRDFRQKPGFGRNEGQDRRPGRSRYPEPDTIRRLTRRQGHTPEHPVEGYPRADLGLPIIFHFVGGDEPPDTTLQGATRGHQRFASPIVTKAVAIDGAYRPMVMILNVPHVWEANQVELSGRMIPRSRVELSQAERDLVRPLAGQSIRDALATYVQGHGFTKEAL